MKKEYLKPSYLRLFFLVCFFFQFLSGQGQIVPDGSFNPVDTGNGYGDGFNASVTSVIPYPSGNKFLVFGNFSSFNGGNDKRAIRLLDQAGASPAAPEDSEMKLEFENGLPKKAIVQPNGKVLVTGTFTTYEAFTVPGIVRLQSNGTADALFCINIQNLLLNGPIQDIKLDNQGRIYLAGSFSTCNGIPKPGLIRLDSSGILDAAYPSFTALAGASFNDITIAGNKLVAGGTFLMVGSASASRDLAILNLEDGSLAYSLGAYFFNARFVRRIPGTQSFAVVDSVVGNTFRLTQVDTGGISEPSMVLTLGGQAPVLNDILAENSGFVLVGKFSSLTLNFSSTSPRNCIARVSYGTATVGPLIDAGFANSLTINGAINCISAGPLSSPGTYLIGGEFRRLNNFTRSYAAKLNATASASNSLTKGTGSDRAVYCSLIQPDNKILVGGEFGYFNWNFRNGISRLLPDGSNDAGFAPGAGVDGSIHAIALQADGKILAGGVFSTFNNVTAKGIVRLNSDGTRDFSFSSTGTSDSVLCIAIQPDGKILLGGTFTSYGGFPYRRIVRLNSNGSLDQSFSVGIGGFDSTVRAIALYKDSLIFVGGDFSSYNGNPRSGLICMLPNGISSAGLNFGSGVSAGGRVRVIAISHKKEVYAGGLFSDYNGYQNYQNIVRASLTGVPDLTFDPQNNVDGEVYDILVESNRRGITLVGKLGGVKAGGSRGGLIKLKPKGSKDLSIGNGTGGNGPLFSIKRDSTGKLIITGNFTKFDSIGKNRILRLLENPLELTIWDGNEWDWGDPDCAFDALVAGHYQVGGFNCRNLSVLATKKFYPTSRVEVCRNAFNYSTLVSGEVYLTGNSLQNVEGYFDDLSLDNAAGAEITFPSQLKGTLKLWAGTLKTNDQLTFKSSSSKTARLAKVEPSSGLNGKITMERFVSGGTASWHFLSTPIRNQAQSSWSDDFLIMPNFFFRHNEASSLQNGWEPATDSLKIGKGFRVYLNQPFFNSSATFKNTGIPHVGNFNFPVTFSPGGYGGGGWNLLGNPYPCEVDWHEFSRVNIGTQVHYWNGSQYASYSSGTQIGVNGGGRYIPSSQAFFVKAGAQLPALSVSENAKPFIPQNPGFYRIAAEQSDEVARLILKGNGGDQDETAIRWMPEAQPYFEDELDTDKLMGKGINFFSLCGDGRQASIQGRNFLVADSVPLGYSLSEAGSYFLEIHLGAGLLNGKTWKLRDNESGFSFPLNGDLFFPFTVDESALQSPFRFTLIGSSPAVSASGLKREEQLLAYPNPGKGIFKIHGLKGKKPYQVQEPGGKVLMKGETEGSLQLESLPAGLYFVSIADVSGAQQKIRIVILP